MASLKRPGKSTFELLEHNCPILTLAERYGEACDAEPSLFKNLLAANVAASHRGVAGDAVCRLWIKPLSRGEEGLSRTGLPLSRTPV